MKQVWLISLVLMLSACGQFKGDKGDPGSNGLNGSNGLGCSVTTLNPQSNAPNGGSLIECGDGSSSLVLNGTNGSNGTNGTSIQQVKFCPGTTTYPSKFIEVGFCVDNKLFAVYSANGGFLTEIPVGYYSSNGINASCSFTVQANCQVSH